MKIKILIAVICLLTLANSGLLIILYNQNKNLGEEVEYIESKISNLDIDALEKIKSKEASGFDCSEPSGDGDWLHSSVC